MNDREALLAAIDANPGEDTPRLAYADFLEESGAVEASDLDKATVEFIKVACGKELQKHRQSVTEGRWLEQNWRRHVMRRYSLPFTSVAVIEMDIPRSWLRKGKGKGMKHTGGRDVPTARILSISVIEPMEVRP